MEKRIETALIYRKGKQPEGRNWIVKEPLKFTLSTGVKIVVPALFATDLSSSPRAIWGLFPPFGDFIDAAILHDYLLTLKVYDRAFCAREMLNRSMHDNKNRLDNWARFLAVRAYDFYINRKMK